MSADVITIAIAQERLVVAVETPDRIAIAIPSNAIEVTTEAIGVAGPPGASGLMGYDHVQTVAAATWTIAHNLGVRPSVSTTTPGGLEMWGTVLHLSDNTLQVSFSTPVTGFARLA